MRTDCRVCGQSLFERPLLSYINMPAAAQCFPTAETLHTDAGTDLDLRQCSSCGLIQLSNAPVHYYKEVIRAAAFSDEMRAFRRVQFQDWIRAHGLEGRKVLEIGCGRGEYLALLDELSLQAFGTEYAAASVKSCLDQSLAVFEAFPSADGDRYDQGLFDAFICLNFLEHWPEPNDTLRGVWRNLSDGAVGLVEVPNLDMIIGKGLFSEFIADHLLYFTRDTLVFTLQYNGFEVIECKPVWHDYILSATVRKRVPTDLGFFEDYRQKISSDLRTFIERFPPGKVAVWGAGHQALAVIALAGVGGQIRYVVDSAPFKQGKFTPATHIPIVSPDTLAGDPVDAVIVMAASYSDEVGRIVRRDFPSVKHIAILRDYGLELL